MINVTNVDNFLYGMALANHSAYLSENWTEETPLMIKIVAYPFGMGEHLVYLLAKIITAVAFVLMSIVLTTHYLAGYAMGATEATMAKREVRLKVGFLVLGESIVGLFIDMAGVLCPPLAYKTHLCLKEIATRRCFEKWGIITHDLPSDQFDAMGYFGKVEFCN